MLAYRVCDKAFAELNGEGARLFGGRWNSRGRALVYCSENLSLSVLEQLVHFDLDLMPVNYVWLELQIPERCSQERYASDTLPEPAAALGFGDRWLDEKRSLTLVAPSAVVPCDKNILLNPNHKEMRQVKVIQMKTFHFDTRLLTR